MGMINRNVLYWLEAIKNGIDALVTASGEVKQSDWNEADTDAASYIKNKPTIKQADWNEATATDRVVYLHDAANLGYAAVQGVTVAGDVYYLFDSDGSLSNQFVMVGA